MWLVLIHLKHFPQKDLFKSSISSVSHHLTSGFHSCAPVLTNRNCPSLSFSFVIVGQFTCTLLCLISFCASAHQAYGTLPQCVVKHTCKVNSYRCVFPWILHAHIWPCGIYTSALLKHHVNELSDITLYDEIYPHCTLHMMNWAPCRQNKASAVFVCVNMYSVTEDQLYKNVENVSNIHYSMWTFVVQRHHKLSWACIKLEKFYIGFVFQNVVFVSGPLSVFLATLVAPHFTLVSESLSCSFGLA